MAAAELVSTDGQHQRAWRRAGWLGVAVLGWATGATAAPASPVRVGTFLTSIDYAPYYVARDNGCLARRVGRGGAISPRVFTTLDGIADAVARKELDLVLEADTPAILQTARGSRLVAIAPLAELDQELLVPRASPLHDLADASGRRIGVLAASGYHFAVADELAARGIAADRYTIVDTAPGAGATALAAGTIDVWAIWPPILQQQLATGQFRAIRGSRATLNVYAFAATDFVAANRPIVRRFRACLAQAVAAIARDRPAAIATTARETGITIPVIDRALGRIAFGVRPTSTDLAVLNRQAAFLFAHGYIATTVRFDPSFLAAAAAP